MKILPNLTALVIISFTASGQGNTLDQKLQTLRVKQEQAAGVDQAQKREQLATALRTAESDPEIKSLRTELQRLNATGPNGDTRAFMERQDQLSEQLLRKQAEKAIALQPALKTFTEATVEQQLGLRKLLQENAHNPAARKLILDELKTSLPPPKLVEK